MRVPFTGGVQYTYPDLNAEIVGYYDAPLFEDECIEWALNVGDQPTRWFRSRAEAEKAL
jgi:hypothetical protein